MISFQLTMFVSLNPSPPCFIIPVFTKKGSNDTFAQDLGYGGVVKRFLKIDVDDFAPVQPIAPLVSLQCGQEGLMAFWLDEHVVHCGNRTQLKDALLDTELPLDAPFTKVERAMFLNNTTLMEASAEEASTLLKSKPARESYLIRVKKRANLLENLHDEASKSDDVKKFELDSLIKILEIEDNNDDWLEFWRDGWSRFHGHERLVDIAKWRIMTKGLGHNEYDILSRTC